jgi:hypothetical protein
VNKARKALKNHWEARIESENLFAGLKLKNYKTKEVGQTEPPPPPDANPGKNPEAPASP